MQGGMSGRSMTLQGRARLVAVPIAAALVVAIAVGAAARSGGGSGPTNPEASVDAVTIVLTLLGMAIAGAFFFLLWSLLTGERARQGGPETPRQRVPLRTQLLILAGVLLVLAGAVVAVVLAHPNAQRLGAGAGGGGHLPKPSKSAPLPYSATVGGATAGAVVLVLGILLLLVRLRRIGRRGRRDAFLADLEGPDAVPASAPAEGISLPLDGVTVADPLTEPDPRQAVIAAWMAMTEVIGRCWRPREPSEAPFEYLQAALTGAGVQPGSAHRLTTLFETARWGGRPVGEEMRAEAVAALDGVRRELHRQAVPAGMP
jgi:hypothetical protein